MGMDIIETGDPDSFKQYLLEYDNTICGRHPISVFLHVSSLLSQYCQESSSCKIWQSHFKLKKRTILLLYYFCYYEILFSCHSLIWMELINQYENFTTPSTERGDKDTIRSLVQLYLVSWMLFDTLCKFSLIVYFDTWAAFNSPISSPLIKDVR